VLFLSIDSAEEFVGTERFTIERRLGAGGFGVVYRALDRKRGAPVALKALRRTESDALYRFKQEFRSLADIAHPNLVTLYELLCEADRWFFTMELVEGVNFLEYVHAGLRPEGEDPERGASPTASFGAVEGVQGLMSAADSASADDRLRLGQGSPALGRVLTEPETQRLRPALRQLAEGLHALHRAGKLHRDIKPSNVLVTPEGRVVLLDFGLVSDLGPEGFLHSLHLVGTPAYMSPEQAAGRPVTEASDWYGVGVMLYEALTGMRPFPGEFLDVLVEKQQSEPPPPRSVVPGVPEDLDALCRELLQRDPARRPSAREILRRLEPQAGKAVEAPPPISHRAAPFVGRGSHLAELAEAFDRTRQGRAVAVLVRGSSGVGKTALVRRFLEQVRRREPDAIVLSGRSYEQETVPYKALDSLLDALSQYLKRVDPGEAEALLPRDLLALVRLFPVLRQVEAVAHARRRVVAIPDSLELRRRGFRALRELCARLADRRSLVLFVDDLQWGDADSAALLADLLRPPEPPPLLFIGCFRVEGGSENLLLKALLALRTPETSELEVRELAVRDLPPDEAEELARELLEADEGHDSASAAAIARESRGNPFFIDELARHLRAGAAIATGAVSLDDVIWERAAGLPEEARRLLEAVAVAGRPLDRSTARRAAALSDDDQPALAVLRVGHLLRGSDAAPEERIEIYHDRIRQTIVSRLSTEACELVHQRLAFALETSGMPDPESLAIHYQGAGLKERAALYAIDAAEKAAETLAFDRAARLYRLALELGTTNAAAGQRIKVLLGAALANAGRGAEAGEAYLAAAQGASSGEMLELQRLAAEQLLRSGHVDQGLSVLRAVLKRIAMRFPATPRRALLSFLFRRILLHGRGLGFRERPATEIPSETLIRIDTCWSVSAGLSLIDTIRGRDFQARHLLLALRAGEPYRVARAMGPEAGYTAYLAGWKGRHRTARIVERAMTLAGRVDQPHALGMAYLGAALAAFLEGRWRVGLELAHQCEDILRDLCTGVAWELDMVHVFSLRILVILGKLRELSERLPRLLKEARERGDLFAETSLRTRLSYVLLLMADAPEQAREELAAAAAQWSQQAFYMQHYFRLFGDVETDLYAGAGRLAWERLEKGWWGLEESLMRRAELFRIESQHLRARCAVSAAAEAARAGASPRQLLHLAIRDARRIEREATPWADPLAALVRAGAESVEGQRQKALASLEQAASGLDAADMALYAGAARLCRGRLLGGEAGARLIAEAEAGMRAERVRNPERMTAMLAPGLWSP
jgi:serine/threonine protein kinase